MMHLQVVDLVIFICVGHLILFYLLIFVIGCFKLRVGQVCSEDWCKIGTQCRH